MKAKAHVPVVVAMVFACAAVGVAAVPGKTIQVWTRYWTVPPDLWKGHQDWAVPEKAALDHRKVKDLGIAFSGGGTRSAAATLGELRGLYENGWLKNVRYMTAVSGGSWTSVPFVYSTATPEVLLGKVVPVNKLTRAFIDEEPPKGTIAHAIVHSGLFASGALESGRIVTRAELAKGAASRIPSQLQSLVARVVAGKTSQTYANMLARIFIDPFVTNGDSRRYTWNPAAFDDIKGVDSAAPIGVKDFVQANEDRPFLIVGGTIIYQHPAYDYPRLIPVEYTPLYTGVRQQYGDRLGGIYVSPYAYDAVAADHPDASRVHVTLNNEGRPFTLADMIASSGAAPLLALSRGVPIDALKRATVTFPAFNHFSVRKNGDGIEATPVVADLLHGDGGFSDNLGVMPLLARGVKNILVFVNGSEPFTDNESIESLFWALNKQEDTSGDRSMNAVFDSDKYWEVKKGLADAVRQGEPPIYCGTGWHVHPNELYNVAEYNGLNICFINNEKVDAWVEQLPPDTRELVTSKGYKNIFNTREFLKRRAFRNFPWFETFEQNAPFLIKLHAAQVMLLSQYTSWMLTDAGGRAAIEQYMKPVLQ
jgi:hypothetical protein